VDTADLSPLTTPSLALLRYLADRNAATTWKQMSHTRQWPDMSPSVWVTTAALLDALSRGVFVLKENEGPNGFRMGKGPAFADTLPESLSWMPPTFDAECAERSYPKKNHYQTELASTWVHWQLPLEPAVPPEGTPKGLATGCWPTYGRPVWWAAKPLVEHQWVTVREGNEGFWKGWVTYFAMTARGREGFGLLGGLTPQAEKRVRVAGPPELRPGPLKIAALLLVAAEHSVRTGPEKIFVGPEGPVQGDDLSAARAVWLAHTVLVGTWKDEWITNRQAGKTFL
jgi:hypothetical protein